MAAEDRIPQSIAFQDKVSEHLVNLFKARLRGELLPVKPHDPLPWSATLESDLQRAADVLAAAWMLPGMFLTPIKLRHTKSIACSADELGCGGLLRFVVPETARLQPSARG